MTDIDLSKGLFLRDGSVLRKEALVLAAGFNDEPDGDRSRVIYRLDGAWQNFNVPTDAMVSATASGNKAYLVGVSGLVIEVPLSPQMTRAMVIKAIRMWAIKDAVDHGDITRIRAVAGEPYCCGQCGQVYRFDGGNWSRADAGLRSDDGPDLEDIDGSGPKDIYVVGIGGAMYHFDGRNWQAVAVPTNLHLSNVRCASPDLYYVCGDDGLILRGARDQWQVIGDPVPDKNYWGLALFDQSVYLAHGKGIDRLVGDVVEAVDIGIEGRLTFHRLDARDGQLWSFGEDDMLVFDGGRWQKVDIPVQ
jgi:hypothetical protein